MELTQHLGLRDSLRIVYGRWPMILSVIVAGLLSALLYNWKATPVFVARATLQIDAYPNVLGSDRPMLELRDWMREYLPTQIGILESSDLARVAHDELKHSPAARDREAPTVADILAGRTVSNLKDTRLVNVAYASTDAVLAAEVANALARAAVQLNSKARSGTLGEASAWLARQVEEQRNLVQASEAALQRYREKHGADALFTDQVGEERQNIVVQRLAELQSAVTKAKGETIDKQAQYEQLSAIQASHEPIDTLPAVASNAYVQGLKTELASAQREMAQASKELGERHPEMIKLEAAVQNADRKLRTEIANVVRGIRNDFTAAQSRERALVGALERQKAAVQTLNAKSVEYTALEREATSNREVLDKLLQRSREAALGSELQSTNVRIVDPAQVPAWPIFPRTYRNIILGLVGSGALALALVFLLEMFNTRVTSPDDVKRYLRISILGVVPQIERQEGQPSLLGDGAPTQFTELLNAVRTNLVLAPALSTLRTVLVTSSEPREGKTMAAANLAVSLARLNQRVLLIDADLRRPRLHEVFGAEQQPGLTDVLTGRDAHSTFQDTSVTGLSLMPAGRLAANPTDLLGSERFNRLIERLQGQFDWILLDSPPILAVTDPCLIARTVSGVVFVMGCDQTSRAKASAAVERLEAVGANIIGAVLNRVVLGRRGESFLPYYHQDYSSYSPQPGGSLLLPGFPETVNVEIATAGRNGPTSQELHTPPPHRDPDRPARPRTSQRVEAAQRKSGASPVVEAVGPNPWDI
jgi:polysaccharide biosynthesis transport protein